MYEILCEDTYHEYNEFLSALPFCSFLQTVMWADVKAQGGWTRDIIVSRDDSAKITAGMLVLSRKLPFSPFTFLYSPRGPLFLPGKYKAINDLKQGLKELAKRKKSLVFKADPAINARDADFIGNAEKAGFEIIDTGKDFGGVQPKFVYILNIKDKTPEDVFEKFHSKTRYNIRLSSRKGVTVRVGGYDDIPCFYEILKETAKRDNFAVRTPEYFRDMYKIMAPENLRLYIAELDGRIIAGTIAIYFKNTVYYLYGASSNQNRNTMPNYLLQWEMIKWAIEKKCETYDFMGISGDDDPSNPLYGLYKFKRGFSGETIEYIGELEMVFNPFMYRIMNIIQKLRKKQG